MNLKTWIGKLNIADWFSLYRILAVPLLLALIIMDKRMLFAWFLLISLLTDMVDGIIARSLSLHSDRGTKLDSYGDFLTLLLAVAGLIRFEMDFIKAHLVPFLAPLVLYFLQIVMAIIRFGKPTSFHTYLSKFTFLLQGAFILALFFFGYWPVLFYASIITGIIASLEEIVILYLLPFNKSNVKGLYWVLKERK